MSHLDVALLEGGVDLGRGADIVVAKLGEQVAVELDVAADVLEPDVGVDTGQVRHLLSGLCGRRIGHSRLVDVTLVLAGDLPGEPPSCFDIAGDATICNFINFLNVVNCEARTR